MRAFWKGWRYWLVPTLLWVSAGVECWRWGPTWAGLIVVACAGIVTGMAYGNWTWQARVDAAEQRVLDVIFSSVPSGEVEGEN